MSYLNMVFYQPVSLISSFRLSGNVSQPNLIMIQVDTINYHHLHHLNGPKITLVDIR